ncbi:MAG: ROK family protein [Acidobacteria bacterium]|nr:ROK family protein [Acidobacteriota bacterium]
MKILGIDVGGTGVKGAVVDTRRGAMITDRFRLLTPRPARPEPLVETIARVVAHFRWKGPVGCGFPAAIVERRVSTAANISKRWIGIDVVDLLQQAARCPFTVLNDADAAGIAEMRFGAGKNRDGLVIFLTLGTGIGSALFIDQRLVPNTELGHIEIDGREAEKWASDMVREKKNLSWKKWAGRIDTYLHRMQQYFWPGLFIIGGGASKNHDKFLSHLTLDCEVVPAQLRNDAGIIGAAAAAAEERHL